MPLNGKNGNSIQKEVQPSRTLQKKWNPGPNLMKEKSDSCPRPVQTLMFQSVSSDWLALWGIMNDTQEIVYFQVLVTLIQLTFAEFKISGVIIKSVDLKQDLLWFTE